MNSAVLNLSPWLEQFKAHYEPATEQTAEAIIADEPAAHWLIQHPYAFHHTLFSYQQLDAFARHLQQFALRFYQLTHVPVSIVLVNSQPDLKLDVGQVSALIAGNCCPMFMQHYQQWVDDATLHSALLIVPKHKLWSIVLSKRGGWYRLEFIGNSKALCNDLQRLANSCYPPVA